MPSLFEVPPPPQEWEGGVFESKIVNFCAVTSVVTSIVSWLMRYVEGAFTNGVALNALVQDLLLPFETSLVFLTTVGDPASAFLLVFPLLQWTGVLNGGWLGVVAFFLSDIGNGLLKLPLRGDRPFWVDTTLRQYMPTCETGYGMPSGHVMVSTSLLATCLGAWVPTLLKQGRLASAAFLVIVTLVYIGVIAISRVFVAAHFANQTAYGFLGGLLVAFAARVIAPKAAQFSKDSAVLTVFTSVLISIATIVVFEAVDIIMETHFGGIKSVMMAKAACKDKSAIHYTTAPMAGVYRNLGVIVGWSVVSSLSISTSAKNKVKAKAGMLSRLIKAASILGLVFGMHRFVRGEIAGQSNEVVNVASFAVWFITMCVYHRFPIL